MLKGRRQMGTKKSDESWDNTTAKELENDGSDSGDTGNGSGGSESTEPPDTTDPDPDED